jgi:adenylate cyclase
MPDCIQERPIIIDKRILSAVLTPTLGVPSFGDVFFTADLPPYYHIASIADMGTEIERKFLVANDRWREYASGGKKFLQGYLGGNDACSIRVRLEGDQANLNIKSRTLGIQRNEYEFPIPLPETETILQSLCEKPLIEKTRFCVTHDNHLWEIDVFSGENEGLVVAEIELASADEAFTIPDWAGDEVSGDPRYYNVCLVSNPYKNW